MRACQDHELGEFTSHCSIRIAAKKGGNSYGTGVLLVKRSEQVLMLTAAHVMENILQSGNTLYLTFTDSDGHQDAESLELTRGNEHVSSDSKAGEVFFHPKFNKDDLSYDIALVVLSRKDWMKPTEYSIGEELMKGEQLGCGFPSSASREYKETDELAAKKFLEGTVDAGKSIGRGYEFTYSIENIGTLPDRDCALEGFSGTGLFQMMNEHPILTGLVSGPYGDSTAGSALWAARSQWAIDIDSELNDLTNNKPELSAVLSKDCKSQIRKSRNSSLYIESLDPLLYTDLRDEQDNLFQANKNEAALLALLGETHDWDETQNRNVLIVGDGGIGKTATMLGSCFKLLNSGKMAVYIPLRALGTSSKNIKSYIFHEILGGDQRLFDDLEKIAASRDGGPRLYFFLDGFNELSRLHADKITSEIEDWKCKENIQIIISSRRILEKDGYDVFPARRFTMQRLTWDSVKKYLEKNKVKVPYKRKMSTILGIPLMLKLYVFIQNKLNSPAVAIDNCYRWIDEPDNSVHLLWNYIQCQIFQASSLSNNNGYTIYDYVAAAEYIAPYVAAKMNDEECYSAPEYEVRKWIQSGLELLRQSVAFKKRHDNIKGHKPDIEWTFDRVDKNRVFNILFHQLNLFTDGHGHGEVSFVHQDFQDILHFIYIENSLYDNDIFYEGALEYFKLPYDLISLIAQRISEETMWSYWENLRNKSAGPFGVRNVLEIIKRLKGGDLSQIDFSGMDLRNVNLSGTILSTESRHPHFEGASIGNRTFFTDGHSAPVTSVDFDPVGGKFVSASYDKTLQIWAVGKSRSLAVLDGHSHYVRCVAWSPLSGKWIASGGDDRRLILWDAYSFIGERSKRNFQVAEGHKGWIYCLDWSKNELKLASGDSMGNIILWEHNAENGFVQIDWKANRIASVLCLLWNPIKMDILGAGFGDGVFQIWDVQSKKTRVLEGLSRKVRAAAWSPDGSMLAICDETRITVWNFKYIWEKPQVSWNWNEKRMYSVAEFSNVYSGTKILWTEQFIAVASDREIFLYKSVELSPKGIQTRAKKLKAWERKLPGHMTSVNDIAWSPKERTLISCSEDGSLRLWEALNTVWNAKWDCVQFIEGGSLPVRCVAWSPDNREIIAGYDDNKLRIWDVQQKRCRLILGGHEKRIKCVAWAGDCIVSGGNDNRVQILNIRTGERFENMAHKGAVNCVIWMPDNQRVVSGSDDGTLCIWDYKTGKKLWLQGHTDSVYCAAVAPDGNTIVSGSNDRTLRFWDSKSATEYALKRITAENQANHTHPIRCVAWSPDETLKMVISGSNDKTLRRWNAETQEPWQEDPVMTGHTDFVYSLSWDAHSEFVVSGSTDNTLIIWNAKSGKFVCQLKGHTNYAQAAAWSPSGTQIASGSCDGTIRIWNAIKKESTFCEKILTALPFVNIIGCNFTDAEFEDDRLKEIVQMNGGIQAEQAPLMPEAVGKDPTDRGKNGEKTMCTDR